FITWDESDFTNSGPSGFGDTSGCCDSPAGNGGGHVVTLTISHSDHSARTSSVDYNHYSMLATIEGAGSWDAWLSPAIPRMCNRWPISLALRAKEIGRPQGCAPTLHE